jgi:hypothetical protein
MVAVHGIVSATWSSLRPCVLSPRTGLTCMAADDLRLAGESKSSLFVPLASSTVAESLGNFLEAEDSDKYLLGSRSATKTAEGQWIVTQDPVEWFSISVQPIFHQVIMRRMSKHIVEVRVLETTLDVAKGGRVASLVDTGIAKVMSQASMGGGTIVRWEEAPQGGPAGWILSADISLSLEVSRPRYLPIPRRVFQRVGSGIIGSTCKERGDIFLRDLSRGYTAWSSSRDR